MIHSIQYIFKYTSFYPPSVTTILSLDILIYKITRTEYRIQNYTEIQRRRRRFVRIYGEGGLKSSDSDTLLSLRLEIDRSKPKPTSQIGGSPLLVHRERERGEEANESRGIIAFKIRLRHLFSDSRRLVGNFIKGFNWLYIRPVKYESVPREIRPDWIERLSHHRLLSTYTHSRHSFPPNFLLLSSYPSPGCVIW